MDRLKRFALNKVATGLDKVLEAKAHFDKKEDKKKTEKNLIKLKEVLSNKLFHSEDKDNSFQIYGDLQKVSDMQRSKELDSLEKKTLNELVKKYL